jgi:hypothetical protein
VNDPDKSIDTWKKYFQPLVLILLTSVLALQLPLESKRPAIDPRPGTALGIQLDARLWMDPFDAPRRDDPDHKHETNMDDLGGQIVRHMTEDTANIHGNKVIFLAVMVDGGPYFESLERRRRTRYAVISGLMVKGYIPEDRDHIRYLFLKKPFDYYDPQDEARVVSQTDRQMPQIIPYEWYKPKQDDRPAVMVLWLDENQMGEKPLTKLKIINNLLRLDAMRAIYRTDNNACKRMPLYKAILDHAFGTRQTGMIANRKLKNLVKPWRQAEAIKEKLGKAIGPEELNESVAKELKSIGKALSHEIKSNEDRIPNIVTDDCLSDRSKIDLTPESFILRLLGPERTETELLAGLEEEMRREISKRNSKVSAALNRENFEFKVLGPATSDGLLAMLANAEELCRKEQDNTEKHDEAEKIPIYSPAATISNKLLMNDVSKSPTLQDSEYEGMLIARFEKAGYLLRRTNKRSTDNYLVVKLKQELKLRGVKDPAGIALIYERDTLYSRSLVDEFDTAYDVGLAQGNHKNNSALSRYGYYRGLDGEGARKPDTKSSGGGQGNAKGSDAPKSYEDLMQNIQPKTFEFAYGDDQIDYLRRIADDMEQKQGREHRPIRAIGLMGSDVYDKLLILQALKQRFPSALFFTTELDARYFDRTAESGASSIARNLIVASGLDLSPDDPPRHQPETASGKSSDINSADGPHHFRSSLQTAYFKTVGYAVTGKNFSENEVRIFEIGRSKAHDLDREKQSEKAAEVFSEPWQVLVVVLLLSGFLVVRRGLNRLLPLVGITALMMGAFLGIRYFSANHSLEPLANPLEGISIWPTEFIRALSIILSIVFWRAAWMTDITRKPAKPGMHGMRRDCRTATSGPGGTHRHSDLGDNSGSRTINFESVILFLLCFLLVLALSGVLWIKQHAGMPGNPLFGLWLPLLPLAIEGMLIFARFIMRYIDNNRSQALQSAYGVELHRVCTYAFVISSISLALIGFSAPPITPYRGEETQNFDFAVLDIAIALFIALLATVLATAVKIVFVLSVIKRRIMDSLSFDKCKLKWYSQYYMACLYKVGSYTHRFFGLVWYPFIIATLLLVSRSRIFDNWPMPIGLALIFILSFGLLIGCVMRIRYLAKQIRDNLVEGKHLTKGDFAKAINYDVGAYGPILTSPSFGGLAILLGGAGVTDMIPKLTHWLLG